jgi:hypothetical protein
MPKIQKPKPAVVYDDGIRRVDYVGKLPHEVQGEIQRVCRHIDMTLRLLKPMSRTQHPAVRAAIFVLQNIEPDRSSHQHKELARISYLMETALNMLSKMTNSKADYLQSARFNLLYGQTPKRRDRDTIIGGSKETSDPIDEEQPV